MALKNRNLVKNFLGASAVSIKADNASLLIKHIYLTPAAGQYVRLRIGKTQMTDVGYFRNDSTTLGSHLPAFHVGNMRIVNCNLLDYFQSELGFKGYPIANGEAFVLIPNTGTLTGAIIFDEYEKDDLKPTDMNGSEAKERIIAVYGSTPGNINTTGIHQLTSSRMPADWPTAWPFVPGYVPPKTEIEVKAICASPRAADDNTAAANFIRTQYLLLKKDKVVIGDVDGRGFLAAAANVATANTFEANNGPSHLGEYSHLFPQKPLRLDLLFKEGEDLNIFWDIIVATTPGFFVPAELEVTAILKIKHL